MAQDVIRDPKHFRATDTQMRRLVRSLRNGCSDGRAPKGQRRAAFQKRTSTGGRARSPDDLEPEPPGAASRYGRHSVISTPIEIDLLFVASASGDLKRAECSYCHARTRGVRGSVESWWRGHACKVDEELVLRNRQLILRQGGVVADVAA